MLEKIVKIIGYLVLGLSVIICLMFFFKDAPMLEGELNKISDMAQDMKILSVNNLAENWSGTVLNYSIILFILSAVFAVGFGIVKFITDAIDNPKSAVKPLASLAVVVVVCIVSYVLADASLPKMISTNNLDVTEGAVKFVDASLYAIYIFFAITIIALVYSEVSKLWR